MDLEALLESLQGSLLLREFLHERKGYVPHSHISAELLAFWLEIQNYRTITASKEREEAFQFLLDRYIVPGASHQVTLPASNLARLLIDPIDSHSFDGIQRTLLNDFSELHHHFLLDQSFGSLHLL